MGRRGLPLLPSEEHPPRSEKACEIGASLALITRRSQGFKSCPRYHRKPRHKRGFSLGKEWARGGLAHTLPTRIRSDPFSSVSARIASSTFGTGRGGFGGELEVLIRGRLRGRGGVVRCPPGNLRNCATVRGSSGNEHRPRHGSLAFVRSWESMWVVGVNWVVRLPALRSHRAPVRARLLCPVVHVFVHPRLFWSGKRGRCIVACRPEKSVRGR